MFLDRIFFKSHFSFFQLFFRLLTYIARAIFLHSPKNEKFQGLTYYELDPDFDQIRVYFLQNDVYTHWRHDTLYPLICGIISDILFDGKYLKDLLLADYYRDNEQFEIWNKRGFRKFNVLNNN